SPSLTRPAVVPWEIRRSCPVSWQNTMKHRLAALVLLALPSVALAQQEARIETSRVWVAVLCLGPLFALLAALLVLLFVVLRRSGAMKQGEYLARAADHIERANAHMDRQAEGEKRIIELLESIERELKRPDARSEGIKKV